MTVLTPDSAGTSLPTSSVSSLEVNLLDSSTENVELEALIDPGSEEERSSNQVLAMSDPPVVTFTIDEKGLLESLNDCAILRVRNFNYRIEENNSIRLSGQVDSFYHKQMAQEMVRQVLPLIRIDNQIQVDS